MVGGVATMTGLVCGCVPLPGGGVRTRCLDGEIKWLAYLAAVEADPGDMTKWNKQWADFCAHIGQEAWATC